MNFRIIILLFLKIYVLFAQEQSSFEQIKQTKNEQTFYQEVFQNPALMSQFGVCQYSSVRTKFQKDVNKVYRIQKPSGKDGFSIATQSFYPLDSTKTLWGNASYDNFELKNIKWNETSDFELNYPYLTADAVGGNMQKETYSFLGGFSKNYKKLSFGASLDYKGSLSSRDKDPRPKNMTTDLNLKLGVNIKNIKGVGVGAYVKGRRYIQSNNLVFYSEIGVSSIYHLNGMGYFNHLLKGSKLDSYYNGYGYELGAQFNLLEQKDIWFSLDFKQLNIDKVIIDVNFPITSSLTNRDVDVNLTKLFRSDNRSLGLKLNYFSAIKKGVEPIFARTTEGLKTLKRQENYNLSNDTFGLSGLFYFEDSDKLFKFEPYLSYREFREDYSLVKSLQYFDYVELGVKLDCIYKVNTKKSYMAFIGFNARENLKAKTLLRNDLEEGISEMMQLNAAYLAKNIFSSSVDLTYSYKLDTNLNLFFGVKSNVSFFGSKLNTRYVFSTGLIF